MWRWIYEQYQVELAQLLERRDAAGLAAVLAEMFRKRFILGMAPGSLASHGSSAIGNRIWRFKTLDGTVSLAEALGVVTVTAPEHGTSGNAFEGSLEQLVERIEAELGFSMDFPDVGAAYGFDIAGRLVTLESPEQIYSALRLEQAIATQLRGRALRAPRIVEIGGGYGATCLWFLRGERQPERYVIVDLPIVNVLQGYFLSKALGVGAVSLFGEPSALVDIVPNSVLQSIDVPYDVLVNKDSMPEMPAATVRAYLDWAGTTCEGLFFTCNQESTAPFLGERQVLVPDVVADTGAFVRVRRDESWVRHGYVEEIYVRASSSS